VVFVNRFGDKSKALPSFAEKPVLNFNLAPKTFVDLFSNEKLDFSDFKFKKIKAVSAIAKPASFFSLIKVLGLELESSHPFGDHHLITGAEWVSKVGVSDIPVITTSKDASKLKKFASRANQIFVLELKGEVAPEKKLEQLLATSLEKNLSKKWKTTTNQKTKQAR
jgi:tetraacyldisaccharide-1-P 4'-kinase